jgi:hypothetical protein
MVSKNFLEARICRSDVASGGVNRKEPTMAKGQKKSNKEVRKPKQPAAKPPESVHGFKSTNNGR